MCSHEQSTKIQSEAQSRHFDPFTAPVMQLIIHHQHFMRVIMHVLKGNAAAAAPVLGTPLSSTSGEPLSGEHMSISPERPR